MDSYQYRMVKTDNMGLIKFERRSCMKNLSIKPADKFIFNNLKIFRYSAMKLISLIFFGSVFGLNRFKLFQKHHRQRSGMQLLNTAVASKVTMKSEVLKKVCTTQSCSKCHKVLTLQMELSSQLQNSCKIMVHNHACCPYTFTLWS